MTEYIALLIFIEFIYVMISFKEIKYKDWGNKDLSPNIRMVAFFVVLSIFIGVDMFSTVNELIFYNRIKILPLFLSMLFYFINYTICMDNPDDVDYVNKTLKFALSNHIAFVTLTIFVIGVEIIGGVQVNVPIAIFKIIILIVGSIFYFTYYKKQCDSIRMLRAARANHIAMVTISALVLYYEYNLL